MNKTPIAVIITDIHFHLNTIKEASEVLLQAGHSAKVLNVPLLILGDTNDTKGVLRAECINTMIECFSILKRERVTSYLLVGNHDKINEKSKEHTLNFLKPFVDVVETPRLVSSLGQLIPYQDDPLEFSRIMSTTPAGVRVFMHQGVIGANMGEYVLDRSAVSSSLFENNKAYSGHYHLRHQVGNVLFVGNPYTKSFAESEDGPKGFTILYSDDTTHLVPTNLRRHVVLNLHLNDLHRPVEGVNPRDLVWVKLSGPEHIISKINPASAGLTLFGSPIYKLTLFPDDAKTKVEVASTTTQEQLFDHLIDNSSYEEEEKGRLRKLWRSLVS